MAKYLFLLFITFSTLLHCVELTAPQASLKEASSLNDEQWQKIAPHLLPDHFEVKKKLDKIFSKTRITASIDEVHFAGFVTKGLKSYSRTVVAKHPKMKGFVFKFYLDTQMDKDEFRSLFRRIRGAEKARQLIKQHHWEDYFKAPRKWIYTIPANAPAAAPGTLPKHLVIVAEDMHVLDKAKNYKRWKSKKVSKSLLNKVFVLLKEGGFADSPMAFNIPFAKDGRIAFVDTEHVDQWPVSYHRLNSFLSKKMSEYWTHLINQDGP